MPAVTNPWTNPTIFTGTSSEFWNSRPAAAPTTAVHRNTGFRLQRIESGKTAGSFFARFRQRIEGFFSSRSHPRSMPVIGSQSYSASESSSEAKGPVRHISQSVKPEEQSSFEPFPVAEECSHTWAPAVNELQKLFQELAPAAEVVSKRDAQAAWEKFEALGIDAKKTRCLPGNSHELPRGAEMTAVGRPNEVAAGNLVDLFFADEKLTTGEKPAISEEFRNAVVKKLVLLKDIYRPMFGGPTSRIVLADAVPSAEESSAKPQMDGGSGGFTWLDHSSGSGEYFWWDGVSDSSRLESQQKGREDRSETELKTGNRMGSSGSWTSGGIRG